MSKMKYSQAAILQEREDCWPQRRLVKYNGRIYTTFGRLFAVPGNYLNGDFSDTVGSRQYQFTDWNNLRGMYREEEA